MGLITRRSCLAGGMAGLAAGLLPRGAFPATGAADELTQALLVNPHDINGLKQAMWTAMQAALRDLRRRMRAMRKQVRENDIDTWASSFLHDLREGPERRPPADGPEKG